LIPPFLAVAVAGLAANWADTTARPDNRSWRAVHLGALVVMAVLLVVGAVNLAEDIVALT